MGSFYRQQLEDYLKTLDVKADKLYDVGGGQKHARGRTKTWDVKDYVVLDLPDYDLNEIMAAPRDGDFLLCLEVFEYLINPVQAVKNLAALLKSGGRAVVSFPFVYPLHNEVEFDSLRYTETAVKRLAALAGLKIDKVVKRRAKTPTLQKYYQEDGMRPAKGHDHNVTGFIVEFYK